MTERDKGDEAIRVAAIIPLAEREDHGEVEVLAGIVGTDPEIVDEAICAFEEEIGSPALRLTPDQARMEINRFYFSSSTWRAPWEPTGPTPPGTSRLN